MKVGSYAINEPQVGASQQLSILCQRNTAILDGHISVTIYILLRKEAHVDVTQTYKSLYLHCYCFNIHNITDSCNQCSDSQ